MATPVPIRSSSITKRLLIYYTAILVGFAAICIFFYRNNQTSHSTTYWVRHTQTVIERTHMLTALYKDLQWENRNYIRTGDTAALNAYRQIRRSMDSVSNTLRQLVTDNPRQRANVAALQQQLNKLKDFTGEAIRQKSIKGYDDHDFDANIRQQVIYHNNITLLLDRIRTEENRLLAIREKENGRSIATGALILAAAGGLTFLLLLLSFTTIYYHIRHRQQAEKAVSDSEARFQLLINNIKDLAIFMTDPQGNILNWYYGAFNLKGYRYEEVTGRNIDIFYTPEDIAAGEPARNLQMARELGSFESEGWRVRKDGSRFWADILITAIYDAEKHVAGFTKVTRDFSLHKKAEDEIRAALEKEKQLNQMKSNFVTLASHEFRTPLSTILSSASLLEQYNTLETQDKKTKHIERIKAAVGDLVTILEEFLSLEKIEEGRAAPKKEYYDINEQVSRLCAKFAAVEKAGHVFKHEHSGSLSGYMDRAFADGILTNLLSNAVKYSPAGSSIFINSCLEDDTIRFVVRDEGIGISEADQQQLFERFFRASNTGAIKGTGLGLHIVKRYVDLLRGNITIKSELDKGSEFTVCIPSVP